jgi:hypothetical protein
METTERGMILWAEGTCEAPVPDSAPDLVELFPELENDGFTDDEMEMVREARAPHDPSHPNHRAYCPGCPACDREP